MEAWAALSTELLWRHTFALIPLVLIVAALTRWLPCRPATKHLLWVTVLLWLAVAPWLPQPPSGTTLTTLAQRAGEAIATTRDALASIRERRGADFADEPTSLEPPVVDEGVDANGTVSFKRQRSVARLHPRGQAHAPRVLAQASGPNGPPTYFYSTPLTDAAYTENPVDRTCDPSAPVPPDHLVASTPQVVPEALPTFMASRLPMTFELALAEPSTVHTADGPGLTTAAALELSHNSHGIDQPGVPTNSTDSVESPGPSFFNACGECIAAWIATLAAAVDAILALPAIPVEVWGLGAVVLALAALLRIALFHRLVGRSTPASAEVQRVVRMAGIGVGVRRIPATYMTEQPISPMVWCGRRARLVLPTALWEQLDDRGRRAVVYHELAHLRRRDHWVSWFEMLMGIAYWWYPLVWWIRSRVRAEAENSCDAWVTTLLPRDRRAYAEALLRTTHFIRDERRRMPAIGIGVTTGRANCFARRLRMVMTETVKPRSSFGGMALVLLIAALGWIAAPARSCPKDEAKASATAPCAKPAVATAASPCSLCKGGNPCKGCTKAAAVICGLCKGCAAGGCKICERCQSEDGCKSCAKCCRTPRASADGPAVAPRARTTYEDHMAERGELPGPGAALVAQAIGVARDGLRQIGGKDDELEERLERLEEQLSRLAEKLERMTEGDGPHRPGEPTRTPTPPNAPRAPRHSMPPQPPQPPMPGNPPHGPRALAPPPLGHFELLGGEGEDDDDVIARAYRLPDGKRQALINLMARDDVPVRIRALPDGIEVQATPRRHRVFRAFVNLIHPEGDEESDATPPPGETFQRERIARNMMAREHSDGAREAMKHVRKEIREAMRRAHTETRVRSREAAREIREHQLEAMEKAIDEMREHSDKIREKAEKLREKADKLREKAEKAREKAGRAENADESEPMLAEALNLENQAVELQDRAVAAEDQAGSFDSEVEVLNEQLAELSSSVEEFELENGNEENAEEEESEDEDDGDDEDNDGDDDDEDDDDDDEERDHLGRSPGADESRDADENHDSDEHEDNGDE